MPAECESRNEPNNLFSDTGFVGQDLSNVQAPPINRGLDAYEICKNFPGISPLNPEVDSASYSRFFKKHGRMNAYSDNFCYHLQASRGTPLKFIDYNNGSLFTLAFGNDGRDVIAIAPVGEHVVDTLATLAQQLKDAGITLYVKKISLFLAPKFHRAGFVDTSFENCPRQDLPDDIFSEVSIKTHYFNLETKPRDSTIIRKVKSLIDLESIEFNKSMVGLEKKIRHWTPDASDSLGLESLVKRTRFIDPTLPEPVRIELIKLYSVVDDPRLPAPSMSSHPQKKKDPKSQRLRLNNIFGLLTHNIADTFPQNTPLTLNGYQFSSSPFSELSSDSKKLIEKFVFTWAAQKARDSGLNLDETRDALDRFTAPYQALLAHSEHLLHTRLFILSNQDQEIVACSLIDTTAPHTASVIMNLANRDIPGLSYVSIACLVYWCKAFGNQNTLNRLWYLNLGGSEEKGLHQFKTSFEPYTVSFPSYMEFCGTPTMAEI